MKSLKIKKLYVNSHTLSQFISRNKKYSKIVIPNDSKLLLMVQRYKKNVAINELKGVIDLGNELYAIVNVYKNKQTSEMNIKVLTILTHFQMAVSNNMGFGSKLEKEFHIEIEDIIEKETFFNYDENLDFIKSIVWDDDDVVNQWIEIEDIDKGSFVVRSSRTTKILRHNQKKGEQIINIIPKNFKN